MLQSSKLSATGVEFSYTFLYGLSSQYPALLGKWPLIINNISVGSKVACFPPGPTYIVYLFLYVLASLIFQWHPVLKLLLNSVELDSDVMLKMWLLIFNSTFISKYLMFED